MVVLLPPTSPPLCPPPSRAKTGTFGEREFAKADGVLHVHVMTNVGVTVVYKEPDLGTESARQRRPDPTPPSPPPLLPVTPTAWDQYPNIRTSKPGRLCARSCHGTEKKHPCDGLRLAQRGGQTGGQVLKKKGKKKLTVQFLCESDKVQLFSFSMRTLLNRIYMYIYKYILKLYKRKKKTFSKCCLTIKQKVKTFDGY